MPAHICWSVGSAILSILLIIISILIKCSNLRQNKATRWKPVEPMRMINMGGKLDNHFPVETKLSAKLDLTYQIKIFYKPTLVKSAKYFLDPTNFLKWWNSTWKVTISQNYDSKLYYTTNVESSAYLEKSGRGVSDWNRPRLCKTLTISVFI